MNKKTFFYFAYGSNMLKKRIHINNPSAVFVDIGRLTDHRLDFIRQSERWGGASATIVPTANAHVWGAIWELDQEHMETLDKQEGVDTNWYFAKDVEVLAGGANPTIRKCRVYQQVVNPPPRGDNDEIPVERYPSKTYMEVLIKGAIECNLPEYYIEQLKKVKHNGKSAIPELLQELTSKIDLSNKYKLNLFSK